MAFINTKVLYHKSFIKVKITFIHKLLSNRVMFLKQFNKSKHGIRNYPQSHPFSCSCLSMILSSALVPSDHRSPCLLILLCRRNWRLKLSHHDDVILALRSLGCLRSIFHAHTLSSTGLRRPGSIDLKFNLKLIFGRIHDDSVLNFCYN